MAAILLAAFLAWGILGWLLTGRRISLTRFLGNYIYNLHVAASQAAATLLCWADPDESLSSLIGRRARAGDRWAILADRLARGHFLRSIEHDRGHNAAAARVERP